MQCQEIDSVTSLCVGLGIFRLTEINILLAGLCFALVTLGFLHYSTDFFTCNYEIHSYKTRSAQNFLIPQVKTNLGKTGIKYRERSLDRN